MIPTRTALFVYMRGGLLLLIRASSADVLFYPPSNNHMKDEDKLKL